MDRESRFRELRSLVTPTVGARRFRATNQTIPNNTQWTIVWDMTSYGFGLQLAQTASTIVLPTSGLYVISHQALWADNGASTGRRRTIVLCGGRTVSQTREDEVSGSGTICQGSAVVLGRAGESVRLDVIQNSGGDLDVSGGEAATYLELVLVTTVQAPTLG